MIEKVLNKLEKVQGRQITVNQGGFINSKLHIQCVHSYIKKDILSIEANDNSSYIRININQIYDVIYGKNYIELFLDNDIKISLEY